MAVNAPKTGASSFTASDRVPSIVPGFQAKVQTLTLLETAQVTCPPRNHPWGHQDPNKLTGPVSVTNSALGMVIGVGNTDLVSLGHMDPQMEIRHSWDGDKAAAIICVLYNMLMVEILGSVEN